MFTGIIESTGKVKNVNQNKLSLLVKKQIFKKLKPGDSLAIDGVCLTVERKTFSTLEFVISEETDKRTNFKFLKSGTEVNLETSATPTSFLSGHIVTGHIDGVGQIKAIKKLKNSWEFVFSTTTKISQFLVEKGAVAINGISLTIIKEGKKEFKVAIIPHTFFNTDLKNLQVGVVVNIEVDILAKYIKKFLK
jgi:riboflavin synthase